MDAAQLPPDSSPHSFFFFFFANAGRILTFDSFVSERHQTRRAGDSSSMQRSSVICSPAECLETSF